MGKPEDWVDDAKMDDPEAEKPDDWDDQADGEWEPPLIDNPEFKGEWKSKRIENPDYKGPWVHPEIDNPDFVEDDELYMYEDFGIVGIDIWQVKAGTIFDNIIITDSLDEAKAFMKETFSANKDAEKEMCAAAETARREKEEAD